MRAVKLLNEILQFLSDGVRKCTLTCIMTAKWLLLLLLAGVPAGQIASIALSHHHSTTTTVLRPFFQDHPGEPVPEENFWTSWCKGSLTALSHKSAYQIRHVVLIKAK